MSGQWKLICRLKDLAPLGTRLVPRGLAWQDLPGVLLVRGEDERVLALLVGAPHPDGSPVRGAPAGETAAAGRRRWHKALALACSPQGQEGYPRSYTVRLEDGRIYLDLEELSEPASRAEAALAGSCGVRPRLPAFG
ncbi:hypothetical protein ACFOLJ_14300 [Rugamonas sp. CCM 8940]|uniref:hypothetical protein n=1 Tax=Rugamonas sp. CCM 8940 TaxID=2765359 RepID=UPI0018F6F5BE|nr:hypothetical protein [Rugamonas sp. CCM 8940]MBJ7311315.1 hypothetical protein [Rugamonas sp. CCM 8940]